MNRKHFINFSLIFIAVLFWSFSSKENFQIIKTQLRITIVNDMGNQLEGVKVSIFENQEDYHSGENVVQEGVTDKRGRVTFSDLSDKVYWVHAEKDKLSNAGLGAQTDTLQAKRLNQATIVVQ